MVLFVQDDLNSLRSSQILRSLGSKSSFSKAADVVVRHPSGQILHFLWID